MPGLAELIASQLGGSSMSSLGQAIGADEGGAAKAVSAALPLLIGALSRNASDANGAESLHRALAKDHDGSLLDDLSQALGPKANADGRKIMGHTFGGRQAAVETGVARASGLDSSQVTQLMATLAPVVLGALGKKQRSEGLDAGGLARALAGERQNIESESAAASLVSGLLDKDGDGSVVDDLGSLGAGLLRGFMKGSN